MLWQWVLQHSKRLRISLMARRFGDVSMMWFCGCGSAFMPLCMPAHKAHRMCERIAEKDESGGWQNSKLPAKLGWTATRPIILVLQLGNTSSAETKFYEFLSAIPYVCVCVYVYFWDEYVMLCELHVLADWLHLADGPWTQQQHGTSF